MTSALVPVFAGRPPWVRHAGAWVCVSVHDASYLRQVSVLRQACHTGVVRRKLAAYRRFLAHEQAWYAQIGLTPPQVRIVRPARQKRVYETCRRGHPRTPQNTYVRMAANGWTIRRCRVCLSRVMVSA